MDTYSESKRYNDHMCICKNILNKMKLLLNFTELPSDILIQTRESLKELNTITNDLLELKDGHNINTSEGKLNDEESRNVTQKNKFSLPKIKAENIEKDDLNINRDSKWDPDSLPYNASFMSLALSANELEGVESKVSHICDSPSQTYEEKYKILRSVFFKEKINNLNINNTCICFSPICWTRNLNCNRKDALLNSNDSKPKPIRKKKYTFGPTNFIAMQANIPAKKKEDNESDEDESEKTFKDVSVNTKRIKYRQVSNKEVNKKGSCDSQCPYEASVESLPFELIEYEVSQKHYITKNFPKKLKEFTRSSLNKIRDKREGTKKSDSYPYEPSMKSLPVAYKNTETKSQKKRSNEKEKDNDSTTSGSSDEEDDLSNKGIQTEELTKKKTANLGTKQVTCTNATCRPDDSDEESDSDDSDKSLLSLLEDDEDSLDSDDVEYFESDESLISEDEKKAPDINSVIAGTDENKMKFCGKSTCKPEKCLKQQTTLDDEEYESIIDDLTKQIVTSPKEGKIYYEKSASKCNINCSNNKDNSKKQDEPKQPTVQENKNEKIKRKDKIGDKKLSDDYTKQIAKQCTVETGIYDPESIKCPAEKCIKKDQIKKRDKRTPQPVIEDEEDEKDEEEEDIYEEVKKQKSVKESKDKCNVNCLKNKDNSKKQDETKQPIVQESDKKLSDEYTRQIVKKCTAGTEGTCPAEKCIKKEIKKHDKRTSQSVQEDDEELEKESSVEEIKDSGRKSHTKCKIPIKCRYDKCIKKNQLKPPIVQDDKIVESDNEEQVNIVEEDKITEEENKDDDEKMTIKENNEIISKKTCSSEKCKRRSKSKQEKLKPERAQEDEEIIEIIEKKNIVKFKNTCRNMAQDDNVAENESVEEIKDETNRSLIIEEIDEEAEIGLCVEDICKSEICLIKNKDGSTEQKSKCPKDIGRIFYETKCEGMNFENKDKSKEGVEQTIQEDENDSVTKKDQIDDKKINKKRRKAKPINGKNLKKENDESLYDEPIEIECPPECIKKESNDDKDKLEDKEMPAEEDLCRNVKCPPEKCMLKNRNKKEDKIKTKTSQIREEIDENEMAVVTNMPKENNEDKEEVLVEGSPQVTKLYKRCPVERRRKRQNTCVDEITGTDETTESCIKVVERRSTASNTNPLPVIQDESTSTVQEGIKIKDMHAWALAYVKLEDDGAKLVQILHTTPYEPGRYLFREPNELILFGPQAGNSRKKK